MTCPACGSPNEPGRKFCGECGAALARVCGSCGSPNAAAVRFCGECGAPLVAGASAPVVGASAPVVGQPVAAPIAPPSAARPSAVAAPQTERRVVSVLFADLVGFTARSDGTDPEEVRDFLSRYFALARETVVRYGGTVEKFIGDAVMAVWGAPVALEDDPERAVRAALDLVDAVRHLGRELGGDELQVRAGVLTGEAAVALGVVGEGMVAGDLVNTASRLQSVAPPGAVLVGEATKRAASGAIVFEEAGEQVLKGKAAPVPAWRALRVVAERGGQGRTERIEAPFVGRADELRLLKDFLHATSRERRVRLLSVTGQAGIGKSRLAWEFLKYIDGVSEDIYWHEGRSPSFGDGVTFWALGEMVRRRAGLAEGDDAAVTRTRIADTLAEYVADPTERRRIEPALLSLLGVGEPPPGGREELFAAWRTFFEQIALHGTTVLVLEDLQWADPGLLDFIDHLLEWSIGYPILVITLARPDLLERRPDWGAGRRNFVALSLGPLSDDAMRELLAGLVPGLPVGAVRTILQRADGIPLYAVETVRMLVEDGKLAEAGGAYQVVGDLGALEIPDSLQSLIAARLDTLDPPDRALLQAGAVLGQTFSTAALAALTGEAESALEPRLRALVHREILQLDTDPRSPERGQHGFTQGLVREVAYSTLARRDRRAKHLAAARHFESLGDEEVAGVLATHYVDAYLAAPDGPEGEAVAGQARIALRAAAERASSLGSHEQAIAFLERARSVTREPAEEALLLERIGASAVVLGRHELAERELRAAIERHRAAGDRAGAARATALLGRALLSSYRTTDAQLVLEPAETEFADLAPDPAVIEIRSEIARLYMFRDEAEASLRWADRALVDAEYLDLVPVIADTLVTKGSSMAWAGRWREGTGILDLARRMAIQHGLGAIAIRACMNLSGVLIETDPLQAVAVGREGYEMALRLGGRSLLIGLLQNITEAVIPTGDWAWVLAELRAQQIDDLERPERAALLGGRTTLQVIRGEATEVDVSELAATIDGELEANIDSSTHIVLAWAALAECRYPDAITHGLHAGEKSLINAPSGLVLAGRSALQARDTAALAGILVRLADLGARGPAFELEMRELRAVHAALEGRWADAAPGLRDVRRAVRDHGLRFLLALVDLDILAVAPSADLLAEEAAAEAAQLLDELGAVPFRRRLDELLAERRGTAPADLSSDGGVDPANAAALTESPAG